MTTDPISAVTNPIVSDVNTASTTAASGTKPEAPKSGAGAGAPSTDTGEVSRAQNLLNTINAMANNIPSVDQQRVDQIRSAIEQGKFQANPQTIAKNLMEIDKLLPGPAGQS